MSEVINKRKITIEVNYKLGEIVYLITDNEQKERIVKGIWLLGNGSIKYHLACGVMEDWFFEIEISNTKDYNKYFKNDEH